MNEKEIKVYKKYSGMEIFQAYQNNIPFDTPEKAKPLGVDPNILWRIFSPNSKINLKKLVIVKDIKNIYWVRKQRLGCLDFEYDQYIRDIHSGEMGIIAYEEYLTDEYKESIHFDGYSLHDEDIAPNEEHYYRQDSTWNDSPFYHADEAVDWIEEQKMFDVIVKI